MDIDKNDIRTLATRIPKILIESSFTLLKTYPKASLASCSLFISYIFVPSIWWFLIYIVPFIVLIIAIAIQTYISIKKGRHAKKHDKDDKSATSEDAKNAKGKYNAKHGQSVRQRRAKMLIAESRQENIEEKETISSTNFTHDPIEKRALIEETPKEIREVEVNVVNDVVNSSTSLVSQDFRSRFNSVMRSQTFSGTTTNIEGIGSENFDDKDDDPRGAERSVVQWSENDQKNLADLGLSEIERNRRLESLIARRRSQKLLSFQLKRAMMDMGDDDSTSQMVHSNVMPNKRNFLSPRSDHLTPVSAPPELSPVQNPFDLPYEPHEEKPNLTGDSFHQEFLGTHQKDMTSLRHERSSSGNILPADMLHNLHNNHGTTQEASERRENNECELGEIDGEKRVEQDQSQEVECADKVEIKDKNTLDQDTEQGPNLNDEDIHIEEVGTKSVIAEDYNGRLSYSSSSGENEPISRLDKEKILKSLSSPHPRSMNMNIQRGGGRIDDILFDYGSSGTEKTKRAECFYYPYDAMNHTPSVSIASDLQVEVSEFGSPPLLSDANNSSPDDERSLCDINFEKEIPHGNDMWTTSSQQSTMEAEESGSRKIFQVPSLPPSNPTDELAMNMSSQDLQPLNTYSGTVNRHESDEAINCLGSPEKLRTTKKISGGVINIHNEDTVKNIDTQNSASGSRLTIEAEYFQKNSEDNLITNEEDPRNAGSKEYLKANIVDESAGTMDIPDSLSTEGNYILESTTDTEDEASSTARSTSELRQHGIQPNEVVPEPELLTEQAPTASSTSSSPKSVLNPRFSADQGHISHISDVVQMETHHSGVETSSSNSNSSSFPAQNAASLVENPTTYQPLERTEIVQEQSNSQLVSTEEATSTSGSLSNVPKETPQTSLVYTNVRNQETNLDTTSSNEEENSAEN